MHAATYLANFAYTYNLGSLAKMRATRWACYAAARVVVALRGGLPIASRRDAPEHMNKCVNMMVWLDNSHWDNAAGGGDAKDTELAAAFAPLREAGFESFDSFIDVVATNKKLRGRGKFGAVRIMSHLLTPGSKPTRRSHDFWARKCTAALRAFLRTDDIFDVASDPRNMGKKERELLFAVRSDLTNIESNAAQMRYHASQGNDVEARRTAVRALRRKKDMGFSAGDMTHEDIVLALAHDFNATLTEAERDSLGGALEDPTHELWQRRIKREFDEFTITYDSSRKKVGAHKHLFGHIKVSSCMYVTVLVGGCIPRLRVTGITIKRTLLYRARVFDYVF